MIKTRLLIGGAISAFHFLVLLALGLTDTLGFPALMLHLRDNVQVVLLQPALMLWNLGLLRDSPGPVVWLVIALNSGLWGFGIAAILAMLGLTVKRQMP